MLGIFTNANKVEVVKMGEEPVGFLENVLQDGTFSREKNYSECYDDLFSGYILTVDVDCDTDGSTVSKNSPNDDHSGNYYYFPPSFLISPSFFLSFYLFAPLLLSLSLFLFSFLYLFSFSFPNSLSQYFNHFFIVSPFFFFSLTQLLLVSVVPIDLRVPAPTFPALIVVMAD